jgi:hypothetical protein
LRLHLESFRRISALVFCSIATASPAQEVLFRFDGFRTSQTLGGFVIGVGDLDSNGVPDIAVGAPQDLLVTGTAYVYSGASGSLIRELDPIEIRGLFGASISSVEDLDGDGVPDLMVSGPFTSRPESFGVGAVLVFSGATGTLLYNFVGEVGETYMGWSVAGTGDLNGDGIPDLMIGTPYDPVGGVIGVGNAVVRSGATGELIYIFEGEEAGDFLGWAVASIDDLDGDGVRDLLLGAPNASPRGHPQAGRIEVRSGRTGALIYPLSSTEDSSNFGKALAAVGDIDRDGVSDFAVAAPSASPNGVTEAGSVFVFSGGTGSLIYRFDGRGVFDEFGASVSSADVDGDGIPDIVIGAPGASPGGRVGAGIAYVFSGATGQLLFQWEGDSAGDTLGRSVAGVGDLNGDGRDEVAFGAPYASPNGLNGAGSVFVITYSPTMPKR